MTERWRRRLSRLIGVSLIAVCAAPAGAASILGDEWEKFFREKVSFGGFIENMTGLSVSHGDRHFNTSNRFIMNRFTIQPEFNIELTAWSKFFISWRFVKEPRYSAEAKSREKSVSYFPSAPVKPLPNTFYDEYSPKPWEAVLDVSPTDRLQIRIGRQFISWGETDGLRLLDVINPQDLTFSPPAAPNLFNLDETRIPSWGLRALYTIQPVTNTIFEFFALPGMFDEARQRVDEVVGSNDTADLAVRYGRWSAHPETRMVLAGRNAFGNLFANPLNPLACVGAGCLVIPLTTRGLPDAGDSWKIGARITHSVGKLNFGLGYIWGYNPQSTDMVFKLQGVQCSAAVVGPCLAGVAPSVARLRLINDRTHILAGHFNYTVDEVLTLPVNTAIRGEIAFYPNQLYNISKFPGPFGLRAGPHPRHPDGTVEKNTLRYALGFDRSVLIPFLQDDPWRAFRMSFQIFQRIILDHEDGIRPFSAATRIRKVSTNLTFRVSTGYFGDTVLPDVFVGYDPAGYWNANPAVTYAPPWNEKIALSLIGAFYGGHNKFNSLGFFSEKDSVFLKMRYQF
ncbi:MAG TPA: DUF1302 family protein [candidate division Zixibacteria bacterium]|nr:DUF1302 family protein [candidate division Zixibacteria bacterium]